MTDITWIDESRIGMYTTDGVPGGDWSLSWYAGEWVLQRLGDRTHKIHFMGTYLRNARRRADAYIAEHAVTVPAPDHPLAGFRAGGARANMHKLYFGGYFWARIHNGELTTIYRPTDLDEQYVAKDLHVSFKTWPKRESLVSA